MQAQLELRRNLAELRIALEGIDKLGNLMPYCSTCELNITIPADPAAMTTIGDGVTELLTNKGWPEEEVMKVELALQEGLANAIRHGCDNVQKSWYERKGPTLSNRAFVINPRQRPTLPPTCAGSTIGGSRLNFRVRNGNGCDPAPMATGKLGAWGLVRRSRHASHGSRQSSHPRAYCDLTSQSADRYLEFLSNSINRNIKLPAVPVWGTVAEYSAMNSFFDHTLTIKRSE